MKRILFTISLLFCLILLYGCQSDEELPFVSSESEPAATVESENVSDESEPNEISTESSAKESAPMPEPEPEPEPLIADDDSALSYQPIEALDWQEDPTLLDAYWVIWDHLEYRLFGPPDEYVKHTLEVSRCTVDGVFLEIHQNDSVNISFMLPPNIVGEHSVRNFDGGFINGPIKIGEIAPAYYFLNDNDNPFQMDQGLFNREGLLWDGQETYYDEVVSRDNVVGGVYQTDRFIRGILPMTRQIVQQLADGERTIELPANHLMRYYIVVDDSFLIYAYFYVSAQATAEDLEVYDAIINSMEIIY